MLEYLCNVEEQCDFYQIYGIFFDCPAKNRLGNCPVNEAKHLSFKEKFIWFNGLDTKKKNCILAHHVNCSHKRK